MIDDFAPKPRKKPKSLEYKPVYREHAIPEMKKNDEPRFVPPEKIDTPVLNEGVERSVPPISNPTKTPKQYFIQYKRLRLNKWQTIVVAVVLLLLIGGGISVALTRPNAKGGVHLSKQPPKPVPAKPVIVLSTLTGLPVSDASVNQKPVTGIMIENSTDARPQSGLDQAGVVFEAVAEGGITRFLALYQDTAPVYVGPVRSARPYYVQWCMGFDCSLAHVGGSPEALSDIQTWGTKNLDQFANGNFYQRISSRYAPHNVYTSIQQLNQLEANKAYGASSYTGFTRKSDVPSKTPNAANIDFAISGYYYNVHYTYDPATNSYARSEGGAAHTQLNKDGSSVQIKPKVVVALIMQQGIEADDKHSTYNVIGSGQAYIFQDGIVTAASWTKSDMKSQLQLIDANNKAIPLNAGQTWFTAVGNSSGVVYK